MLDGVRIIDMTLVVMGPYATQILGDFGADVIKVESPAGDTTRKIGPMRNPDMGNVFLHLNRNKRSVVLDLKQPAALEVFFRLVKGADVLVSNVRPKAMERLGITPARLSAENSRLISASLVGFAQNGPYAARPVYEDLMQGLTAVPTMLMKAGAEHPIYVPMAFNDRAVGLYAANAILAALYRTAKTGRGMAIEIPMFETTAYGTLAEHMSGATFEPPAGPTGYPRSLNPQRRPFATRDGYVCAVIYTDVHWRAFMKLIGREAEFDSNPHLRDLTTRTVHSKTVYSLIGEAIKARTTAEWLLELDKADIPAAPMHTLDTLMHDLHLEATGFFKIVDHPTEGKIREMNIPGTWSEDQPGVRRRAPRLGEHTIEVLLEAGYDHDQLAGLVAAGAVRTP